MFSAIAKLGSSRVLGAIIPLSAAPILGRLYTPDDYSLFILFLSIVSVAAIFVTLQMQQAIPLEVEEDAAANVAWFILAISFSASCLAGIFIFLGILFFEVNGGGYWMLLLPFSLFLTGLLRVSELYATRHREFGFIATTLLVQVVITTLTSILFGVLLGGSSGLFIGFFCGHVIQAIRQTIFLSKFMTLKNIPAASHLHEIYHRHGNFIFYSTPSALLQALGRELPVFFISALGLTGAVGAFGRARQIISSPVNLMKGAISSVFMREATDLYRKTGSCRSLMTRTMVTIGLIGALPAMLLFLYAKEIMSSYLGPQWEQAGIFIQILTPMLFFRLITAPTATVFFFTGHQRLEASLSLWSFGLSLLAIITATALEATAESLVLAYAVAASITYIVYCFFAIRISQK